MITAMNPKKLTVQINTMFQYGNGLRRGMKG